MTIKHRNVGPFATNAGCRQALSSAAREALAHGHRMLRPAHIFLGVLLTPDRRTEAVFSALGISAAPLAEAARLELGPRLRSNLSGRDIAYSRHGKLILERACLYAEHLGWGWLGALHLLHAVSELEWGTGYRLLRDNGVPPKQLRQVIEAVALPLSPDRSAEPPFVGVVPAEATFDLPSEPPAL